MYQNQASPSHNLTTGDELLLQLPITILGYPLYTGHSQHNTPNKCGVLSVDNKTVSVDILPDSLPPTFWPRHADDPRQNDAAWVLDFARPSRGADGRCSTQGAVEYYY